ncbi:MAG: protein kinase [Actinobacteria bacterium]|nr:protein kinase [Actinomycetota bacterium]
MTRPGDLLADRYELLEVLGQGGMGRVYRARDRVLDRDVAVKVMAPHLVGDPGAVQRFRDEARAAARLGHRNVVRIYDTGSSGAGEYIVMELVDGPSLKDLLADAGRLPVQRAMATASAIASALAAAHEQGLVHRDVKPANVLWTSDGTVKVTDFGIARITGDDVDATVAAGFGSVLYLSPEQATGERVDARADIYSLGCVLYEMLAGRPPFTADKPIGILHQHVHRQPDPPSAAVPEVPRALDAVVLRALAKDPDDRYRSAHELRADLHRVRQGEPPLAAGGHRTDHPADDTVAIAPIRAPDADTRVVIRTTSAGAGHRRTGTVLAVTAAVVIVLVLAAVGLGALFGSRARPGPPGAPETQTLRSVVGPGPVVPDGEPADPRR